MGEGLTPAVAAAVPEAVAAVRARGGRAVRTVNSRSAARCGGADSEWRGGRRSGITNGPMRTVADCLSDPAHAGPLDGATRVGRAADGDRMVVVGLWTER